MIIKKFQEQAAAAPDSIAIKTGNRTVTYSELSAYGSQLANAIITNDGNHGSDSDSQRVSLLFEHGVDMIIGVIGTLKAGKAYIPLDIDYPEKRLSYILEDSQSHIILTNTANVSLARRLTGQMNGKADIINIDAVDMQPESTVDIEKQVPGDGDPLAYILYTSGSTGRPKGVMQTHRNVLYYTGQWIKRFSISSTDRMTFITSFSHDQSVQDIFASLLSGACLYPYNLKAAPNTYELYSLLMGEKITIWHSVPSLFRVFTNSLTLKDHFYDMRWLLLGGEALRAHDLELYKAHFPKALLANIYGQTESSFNSSCIISPAETFDSVSIGETSDEMELLLVNNDGELVEDMGVGEIVVASDYIAPGYWGDPKYSEGVFLQDEEMGHLYRTGDLGRFTAQDTIKMIGRKDFQVKIRGFRVETGEIETQLLEHPEVKEAIVVTKEDESGDSYLCAYLVCKEQITPSRFRDFLSRELPDYMIPRYFIHLEQMPVTPNGKVDKKYLPKPDETMMTKAEYEPPGNEVEEKLVAIWQEVLGAENIGINDNFMDMGGHSILVISIISKIHQQFNLEIQLNDVFDNPTVKKLSRIITASKEKLSSPDEPITFSHLDNVEKKEYYELSFNQKRLWIINQLEPGSSAYGIPGRMVLKHKVDENVLKKVLAKIIKRHETFRAGFKLVENQPVQFLEESVSVPLQKIDLSLLAEKEKLQKREEVYADEVAVPFDLTKPPLFRFVLVKLDEESYEFIFNMHHIISDGWSIMIIAKEFNSLYRAERARKSIELEPLQLQYKDFTAWQNKKMADPVVKEKSHHFWKTIFAGGLPTAKLPLEYSETVGSEETGSYLCVIPGILQNRLNQLAKDNDTSLFILMFAVFNILLSRFLGQKDIVCGIPAAGRDHHSLNNLVGFFVNTLILRNQVDYEENFTELLRKVNVNTLQALQHQTYPLELVFEDLDMMFPQIEFFFNMLNLTGGMKTEKPLSSQPPHEIAEQEVKFNMMLYVLEYKNSIEIGCRYRKALFKPSKVATLMGRYIELFDFFTGNPGKSINDYKRSSKKRSLKRN
jgi:amino acid adenylation domain-containing protein